MEVQDGFLDHVPTFQILELPVDNLVHDVSYKTYCGSSHSQLKTTDSSKENGNNI